MSKKKISIFANSRPSDYIRFLGIFIHKRVMLAVIVLLLLMPVGMLMYEIMQTYRLSLLDERAKITYRYDDSSLLHIKGYVILTNEQDEVVYEGEFDNGTCKGQGIVYEDGKKRYVGKLVDNKYEDEKGLLYDTEERLLYEGGFMKGVYEGEGSLYNTVTGDYLAQGTFKNGELNGQGVEYYEDGSIHREGDYLYGRLNGEGIVYYKGSNIRSYEGNFMGNTPIGEGILYSPSGRAWYQGLVYDMAPDYESYVGATFADIREHFLDPMMIYTTNENAAIAIHKQDVIFISAQPYVQIQEEPEANNEVIEMDETKLFIEAIAIKSTPMRGKELLPYEQKEMDGVYAYDHLPTMYSYIDLYAMMLYRYDDGSSPLDAYIDVLETKGEVTRLSMLVPPILIERYILNYHGLCQERMMLGERQAWGYQVVKEEVKAE